MTDYIRNRARTQERCEGTFSLYRGRNEKNWMGVTSETKILANGLMSPGTSAEQAELKALIEAWKLAIDKTGNIYTDSRYGFGVVHDFI